MKRELRTIFLLTIQRLLLDVQWEITERGDVRLLSLYSQLLYLYEISKEI
jgi:hypothetical protein